MTKKEALEILKHQLTCLKDNNCVRDGCEHCPYNISDNDLIVALEVVISILEKQSYIPDPWDGIKPYAPDGFYAKHYNEKGNNVFSE